MKICSGRHRSENKHSMGESLNVEGERSFIKLIVWSGKKRMEVLWRHICGLTQPSCGEYDINNCCLRHSYALATRDGKCGIDW